MAHRAKLDENAALAKFCTDLEEAVISTVKGGAMTKDLALLVHGPKTDDYLMTQPFMDKIKETLEKEFGYGSD